MKLSNQNIYNLRGCPMLLGGGVQIISGGGCAPAPAENPCLFLLQWNFGEKIEFQNSIQD